jgi:hypothetical protein
MSIGYSKNFRFERALFSKLLLEFANTPKLSRNEVMERLGVGNQKAEAMITWLGMIGLRDNRSRELTPLGKLLLKYDPYFEDINTLWLLHYQLASNPDAEVWYLLTNKFLPNYTTFSFEDALNFLVSCGIRPINDQHLRSDVAIFLNSFTKLSVDALTNLNFIRASDDKNISNKTFHKNIPLNISPYLIAYVIYDYESKNFPNAVTITIKELLTLDGNVGKVFSLDRKELEKYLKILTSYEYGELIDISTIAGLDQVGLCFKGNVFNILERYYDKKNRGI